MIGTTGRDAPRRAMFQCARGRIISTRTRRHTAGCHRTRGERGGGGGDSAAVDCRTHGGRTTLTLPTRVRVEIMGSQKCGIVGKSQSILIMIHPIISTRTRAPRTPPI
jgi:hypothetical protein